MRRFLRGCSLLASLLLAACASTGQGADSLADSTIDALIDPAPDSGATAMLVVHGGAGTITRANMTPEREAAYVAALEDALRRGHAILAQGGSSLEAVTATLLPLEDSPLFNAGHGAVLTAARRCELDASVMDGATGQAGAVAGVTTVRNPILAARAVMEQSEHVMLAGEGADTFAREQGLDLVPNTYFHTERRVRSLERRLADDKHGTVGAVAVDANGHLAAATSTGGMTAKRWGRIGDSPVLGAGTWADENVAVSATGWGEFFLRGAIAHDISARVRYAGQALSAAADAEIHGDLTAAGGTGGIIAIDRQGRVAMPFNTEGMYRGWIGADGVPHVAIYGD